MLPSSRQALEDELKVTQVSTLCIKCTLHKNRGGGGGGKDQSILKIGSWSLKLTLLE